MGRGDLQSVCGMNEKVALEVNFNGVPECPFPRGNLVSTKSLGKAMTARDRLQLCLGLDLLCDLGHYPAPMFLHGSNGNNIPLPASGAA